MLHSVTCVCSARIWDVTCVCSARIQDVTCVCSARIWDVTCVCSARIQDVTCVCSADVTRCYMCTHDQVAAETNDPPPGVNCSALSWRCSHYHRED